MAMITPTPPRRVKDSPQVVTWYADAMSTPGGFSVAEPAFAAAPALLPPTLPAAQLRRLLHKYELLLCLRRGEPGRTEQRRDAMRAIAQLFPAALREWEEQPAEELERRHRFVAEQLARTERPEPAGEIGETTASEDWLRYGLDLHDCLRAVLQLRSYLSQQAGGRLPRGARAMPAGARPASSAAERAEEPAAERAEEPAAERPTAPTAERLAVCQELVRGCAVPWLTVTPALLGAIAEPAAGRLTALAYQAVADRHGTSPATIKTALFGAAPEPR